MTFVAAHLDLYLSYINYLNSNYVVRSNRLDCLQLSRKKHYLKKPLFVFLATDGHASLATFLALVVQLSL